MSAIRTHHKFLHPTKGWRMFARPGKANRRRKLIPTGYLMVPLSHAYRRPRIISGAVLLFGYGLGVELRPFRLPPGLLPQGPLERVLLALR